MDAEKFTWMKQEIEAAELVLIGIGEEWEVKDATFEKNERYRKALACLGEESPILPYLKKDLIDTLTEEEILLRKRVYQQLEALVKDKNYFIVSLCKDGLITKTQLKQERIVEPCGTLKKLQCSKACHTELYDQDPVFTEQIKEWIHEGFSDMEQVAIKNLPVCPKCNKPLVFNTILADNYIEEGYLSKWEIYKKWLQGTVNKKVCILELGVGMKYPTVIRWPFEKVAFFNQKASFFRVHSKLYQTAEEIKEKSCGIQATLEDFFQELSICN